METIQSLQLPELTALSPEALQRTGGGSWIKWLPLIAMEFDDMKRGIMDAFKGQYRY